MAKTKYKIDTIFVDCFNTIIFRKIKKKEVFKQWAKELSNIYNINWKTIYKTYTNTNFNICFKKLFTTFTLQEDFDIVLSKVKTKLENKFKSTQFKDFVNTAKNIYIEKELNCFSVNQKLINFLRTEKDKGVKIYLVSDFYCKSDVIEQWFKRLQIDDVFEKIFSSCDFSKEKATGKIYKYLVKELNLNRKQIKMYGDNIWSDIFMAKLNKLNAEHVKTQRREYEKG